MEENRACMCPSEGFTFSDHFHLILLKMSLGSFISFFPSVVQKRILSGYARMGATVFYGEGGSEMTLSSSCL